MADMDSYVFGLTSKMLDLVKDWINSSAFAEFIELNKDTIFSDKSRIYAINYKAYMFQEAITLRIDKAQRTVFSLGLEYALSAAKVALVLKKEDSGDVNIPGKASYQAIEAMKRSPKDQISSATYLIASAANILYEYILFMSIANVSTSESNIIGIQTDVAASMLIESLAYGHGNFLSGKRADKEIVTRLLGQISRAYVTYGNISKNEPSFWSNDVKTQQREPTDNEIDYMVMVLEQRLKWDMINEAIDMVSNGEMKFFTRRDSRGKEFNYEDGGYSEESDDGLLELFVISRILSVPFTGVFDTIVSSVIKEIEAGGTTSGDAKRTAITVRRILIEKSLPRTDRSFLKWTDRVGDAAKLMAEALVAYIASETRRPSVPLTAILDNPDGRQNLETIQTPFLRRFAVYNAKICDVWNFDPIERGDIRDSMLKTTWNLVKDPMKAVRFETVVPSGSGASSSSATTSVGPVDEGAGDERVDDGDGSGGMVSDVLVQALNEMVALLARS